MKMHKWMGVALALALALTPACASAAGLDLEGKVVCVEAVPYTRPSVERSRRRRSWSGRWSRRERCWRA